MLHSTNTQCSKVATFKGSFKSNTFVYALATINMIVLHVVKMKRSTTMHVNTLKQKQLNSQAIQPQYCHKSFHFSVITLVYYLKLRMFLY